MSVPIDVPGLRALVPEVPDGTLLLFEGGADPAKGYLARQMARSCGAQGRQCRFIASRDADEVVRRVRTQRGEVAVDAGVTWADLAQLEVTHDVVIDSFSFLALDADPKELAATLARWRAQAHGCGAIVVLGIERDMLGPREQMVVEHMADGIIRFKLREEADGTRPYLQIPRWTGGQTFARNFYFAFDQDRMMIDTRNRVV